MNKLNCSLKFNRFLDTNPQAGQNNPQAGQNNPQFGHKTYTVIAHLC